MNKAHEHSFDNCFISFEKERESYRLQKTMQASKNQKVMPILLMKKFGPFFDQKQLFEFESSYQLIGLNFSDFIDVFLD